jgi:DNA-binding winged helix-turn-helix (wHTH) protein/Tol biopolymer transport system component
MSLLIKHFFRFGEFTVDTDQKVLLRAGRPVPLTPKIFDTLLVLVQSSGRIVNKEELMNRLWPDSFVEETNLTSNIRQLRKSLGDNARKPTYIETVARRGYRFIADVEDSMIDTGTIGGQIAERFGTSRAQSNEGDTKAEMEIPAQEQSSADKSAEAALPSISEAASTGPAKTRMLFAVALAAALAGAGFAFWGLLAASNKKVGKTGTNANSHARSPATVEQLTRTGQSDHVAISGDGRYFAYTQGPIGNQGIWLRQLSTGTNVEIVPATGPIYGLEFANSGEHLYFVRGNPTKLYRVSLSGGAPTMVIDRLEGKFALSPDDGQIALVRQAIDPDGLRQYSLIVARSDGGGQRTLLAGAPPNKVDAPAWSPDGQSIICAHGNWDSGGQGVSILEVMVADGAHRELCSHRFRKIAKMAWFRDKSGLLLSAAGSQAEVVQLWRLSFPALELSQITEGPVSYADLGLTASGDKAVASQIAPISDIWVASINEPQNFRKITQAIDNFAWATNGQLVYGSTASGVMDLWIMHQDGTGQRQLTLNSERNGTPAITSDNRYIVFISSRTGSFQVWRMGFDGSDQIQLSQGAGANWPSVTPDGKWVVYNTTEDWRLWKVSIDGGEASPLTEYVAPFSVA